MAKKGDRQMIKLLLELHISKPAHVEDEAGGKNQVNILVQNLTKPTDKEVTVIDVTSTEEDKQPS